MIRMVVMIIEANIDDNGNYYEIKKKLIFSPNNFHLDVSLRYP